MLAKRKEENSEVGRGLRRPASLAEDKPDSMLALGTAALALAPGLAPAPRVASRAAVSMDSSKPVVIGLAADSGCGKSTFMRRVTGIFGGESKFNDIGRETNTLVSEMTTVICLDDYHKWDRTGRKSNPEWPDGITALHKDCQNWDKMAEDVLNLKNGVAVEKPIYNHITGMLDPDEMVRIRYLVVLLRLWPDRSHAQSTAQSIRRECRTVGGELGAGITGDSS